MPLMHRLRRRNKGLPCIFEQQKQLLLAQWRWDESEPCVEASLLGDQQRPPDRAKRQAWQG
ncbi:hypothetical protein KBY85_14185 [Cyanobium sp. BA5m-10]|uniref:hypothetical protein n=1 Tax=unclassified Cyanobium TaxID=2627006 RepID=UPI0020CF7DD3|nr:MULTISPECIES: hypothetical protein [unclassified Cyanobium]MCP9905275.1 hypothetical protein [Cyanobium sp. BA5m-10]